MTDSTNKTAAAKPGDDQKKEDTREPQGGPQMEADEAEKHRQARAGNIEFTYKNKKENNG